VPVDVPLSNVLAVTRESAQDVFERKYMNRFRDQVSDIGVVVTYERDRAARDIGVHLFRTKDSGDQEATGSLIWFQMKGLMNQSMTAEEFAKLDSIPVRVRVSDLQLWVKSNAPTYLAVYVESADTFFVLDVVAYARTRFGDSLFILKEKTVTIHVSRSSPLDERTFEILFARGSVDEWSRILRCTEDEALLCLRDLPVIWHIGTAERRRMELRLLVTDWQSKLRGEVALQERPQGSIKEADWIPVRVHLQFMLAIDDVEGMYPHLDFEPADEDFQSECDWSNEDGNPSHELKDGTIVYGRNVSDEYHSFELRPKLNEAGLRLFSLIERLIDASIADTPDGELTMINIAPWEQRLL
jgi:hypothetical protein